MILSEALQRATLRLDAVADLRADAARDAAFLLRHVLGISYAEQLAHPTRPLTSTEAVAYEVLIQRRLTREPIQYITGEQEFYGLALYVTPAVLIPRPETEHLVESVLAELDPARAIRILDIGTGSGAIAIALAHHLAQAHITAIDLSPSALAVAAANATRNGLSDRIQFVQSDLLTALSLNEPPVDVIVSNPPYVPESDRATLHPQVRDHEPASALFAGADGQDIYRRLIPQARTALAAGGLLALEIGQGQRNPIAALLADWTQVRFVDDLQHIPRAVLARKP